MTTCECGAPVAIKKTGECKRCYMRRYKATYVPLTPEERQTRADTSPARARQKEREWRLAHPDANREYKRRYNERQRAQRLSFAEGTDTPARSSATIPPDQPEADSLVQSRYPHSWTDDSFYSIGGDR